MGGKQYCFQGIGSHSASFQLLSFPILIIIVWPGIPEKVGINQA